MFTRLKLSTRILLIGTAIAICFPVPLLIWLLPQERADRYAMETESAHHVVDLAWSVLDYYGRQVSTRGMPLTEAQDLARNILRHERFQGGNYVWINDLRPVMIMHPMKPDMEGKDLSGYRDPTGFALFVEMARLCAARGEGPVRYQWPKPGLTGPQPKISYVKLYPAWGWMVGAGVYVNDIETAVRKSRNFVLIVTGLDLLAALLLSYFLARSVSAPVRRATAHLTQFMEESAAAVDHLAGASQTTASAMSQQAASLEQTSAAVSELTSHTKRSFASARQIQNLAGRVKQVVEDGNRHMEDLNGAIGQIGDSAQKIRRIVKTSEEIAFQTNILALNAAVEAARAGDAGAGFSVVADEVRSLAQRASLAAKETAGLIGDSLVSSQQGAEISSKLAAAFGEIVARIQEVSGGVGQITDSFKAETEGITQIDSAIGQINSVTQAQAATAEETASAAEQLRAQSQSLRRLTVELHELVEGAGSSAE